MDYLKVFAVTDKKAFNDYLKENRNSDLSKVFDNFKNSEIHLVPIKVPNKLTMMYIGETMQEYNIFIKQEEQWEIATYFKLNQKDISLLFDSKSIEDYEEYKQWKKIKFFKVIDKEKFIDFIYDRLSDSEKIAINNYSRKAGNQILYIFEKDDEFSDNYDYKLAVKFEYSPVAHVFPDVTLNENDIYVLTEGVIESLDCKIHRKYNNLSINDSKDYILLSEKIGYGFPRIRFFNDRYVARACIHENNEKGYNVHSIHAFGKTRSEAMKNLKDKIDKIKNLQNKENKNVEEQHSIEDDFLNY